MISKFRPACPIVAVSPHEAIVRRLQLNWGVQAVTGKEASDTDAVVDNAIFAALDNDSSKPATSSSSRQVSPLPKPVRPI